MSLIKARSPYIIYFSETNLNSFVLELFIYTGTKTTDRPASPTYTLEATAYNEEAYIDISEFVRDYIDTQFNGNYTCEAVWVDYRTTRTVNNIVQSTSAITNRSGIDAYSTFQEDQNDGLDNPILQSIHEICKPEGVEGRVPVWRADVSEVRFYKDGELVQTVASPSSQESTDIIQYISDTVDYGQIFYDRVLADGGLLEGLNCYTDVDEFNIYDCDSIVVSAGSGDYTINVKKIPCSKYGYKKVTFINKLGAKKDLYFFGNTETISQEFKSEGFKSNVLVNGAKQTNRHQYKKIGIVSRQSIQLNSGYVDEKYNADFEELLMSELVWIEIDGQTLPLDLDTKNFTHKKHLVDGLIEYQFNAKFGFDRNNTVR